MIATESTLNNDLYTVRPRLNGLAGDRAFHRLDIIGSCFPALPGVGFECRLDNDDEVCDLLLLMDNCTADREFPDRMDPVSLLPRELRHQSAWRTGIRVCEAFRRRSTATMHRVSSIWLELDLIAPESLILTPSIFVGLRDLRQEVDCRDFAAEYLKSMKEIVTMLAGHELAERVERQLTDLVGITAAVAAGYHIGAMLSRRSDALRVCIRRVPAEAILTKVSCAGWPSDARAIKAALEPYLEIAPDPTVHVDIGEAVGAKLGFDLTLARSCLTGQPHDEPRWTKLFDLLVETGLCTQAKRDFFLSWPGGCRLDSPDDRTTYLVRQVNHVKLVVGSENALAAKGYFGFQRLQRNASTANN